MAGSRERNRSRDRRKKSRDRQRPPRSPAQSPRIPRVGVVGDIPQWPIRNPYTERNKGADRRAVGMEKDLPSPMRGSSCLLNTPPFRPDAIEHEERIYKNIRSNEEVLRDLPTLPNVPRPTNSSPSMQRWGPSSWSRTSLGQPRVVPRSSEETDRGKQNNIDRGPGIWGRQGAQRKEHWPGVGTFSTFDENEFSTS